MTTFTITDEVRHAIAHDLRVAAERYKEHATFFRTKADATESDFKLAEQFQEQERAALLRAEQIEDASRIVSSDE